MQPEQRFKKAGFVHVRTESQFGVWLHQHWANAQLALANLHG